jgi:HK97 family phage prohead protease
MSNKKVLDKRMFKHDDYRRIMEVRTIEAENNKMIVEGRAVVFNETTVLFKHNDIEYKEIIERGAFEGIDINGAFLKYNHSDNIMAMARVKNGTLGIEVRDDGVYMRADLADTTAGRDLYTLIKRGDIDKMSFAFTIQEESFDKNSHTWTVRKIDKLYDVAAVERPAYENTQIYARRYDDVEARQKQEVEALALQRKRAHAKLNINK